MYSNCFKTIAFLLLVILQNEGASAQTQKFQKVYGGYSYDYGNDLLQMPDTGYLLLCTSNSFSASSDIYLLKVDKMGAYEWQRTYGGPEVEGACKIKFTQDGNIAIAGYTSSYGNGFYDFYLVKTDLSGDTLWTNHYGTPDWDLANSMDTCYDGGFILAGKTYDTGNAFSDILIVKTDANGNQQWQKKIGGNKDDVVNSIITVSDGYLICGTTATGLYGGNDIYVAKINLNGDLLWENYYGDELDDQGTGIYLSEDNSIVFAGNTTMLTHPNNLNTYIRKIKFDGSIYWWLPNYTNSNTNFITNSIIEGFNKRVTSIGSSDYAMPGITDMVLLLFDSLANYVENISFGGNLEDYGKNVIKTLDYGYAAIGTTSSFGIGLSNIHFVKSDTVSTTNAPISIFVDVKQQNQLAQAQNQAFPNPFSSSTTVHLDFPVSILSNPDFTIRIFNQLGADVSNQITHSISAYNKGTSVTINNGTLSNGLYFYSIYINNKSIAQGKFTLIK